MTEFYFILEENDKWLFISDHYDIHLSGLCVYKNKIHGFKTVNPEEEDYHLLLCEIIPLSKLQLIKKLISKKLFELCVGYHWTYPHRKNKVKFRIRKPRWLYKLLFNVYYWKSFS